MISLIFPKDYVPTIFFNIADGRMGENIVWINSEWMNLSLKSKNYWKRIEGLTFLLKRNNLIFFLPQLHALADFKQ